MRAGKDSAYRNQSMGGGRGRLGWYGSGLKILLDVARGLAFLHNRRVR